MVSSGEAAIVRGIIHLILLSIGVYLWWRAYKQEKNNDLKSASDLYWYSCIIFVLECLMGDILIAILPAIYTGYKGYSLGKSVKQSDK